jgi:hypothetical protein
MTQQTTGSARCGNIEPALTNRRLTEQANDGYH